MSVLPLPVEDEELGSRILAAWDLGERGDPGTVVREATLIAERPLRVLFGVDDLRMVKRVGANRLRARGKHPAGRVNLVATELKGDDNRSPCDDVELPPGADAAAIGAAAKQAMEWTVT